MCVCLCVCHRWDMVKENSVGDDLLKQLAGDGSSSYETDDGEGSDDE